MHPQDPERTVAEGLRTVFQVTDELIASPDTDTLCRKAVESLRDRLGIERCAIFLGRGEEMIGTYGTDRNGNTTVEHECHFVSASPNWHPRLESLRAEGIRWKIEDGLLTEWNGREAMAIGRGWIAFTPLFSKSSSHLLGILVNDSAITGAPVDPLKQEILAVFCALLASLIEHIRSREELRAAKVAAEEANRAKTVFLAKVSHEFRGPLNPILGFTELLLEGGNLTGKQRNYLRIINQRGEDLLRRINDTLHIAKIEVNELAIRPEPTDVRALISDVAAMFHRQAAEKGVRITAGPSDDLGTLLLIDPTRLTQILMNLVGNAIKFTNQGSVHLAAHLEDRPPDSAESQADPFLHISVCDTGIGIAPEHHALVFAPFQQVDTPLAHNPGGTGLGLAICKQLTELMGGTIRVESTPGDGSIFHVSLPASRWHAPAKADETSADILTCEELK
jgi:signal transduction histidine kinase